MNDSLRSNSEEDGCRSSFSLTYVFVQEQLDDSDLGMAFVMGCHQQFGASDIKQGVRRTASLSCGGASIAQG
jgi:hypothetical protein